MKTVFLFALMALAAAEDGLYEVENVDMAALSSNTVEFKKFVDCLNNKGPCIEQYLPYKTFTPEAIQQCCKKCTPDIKKVGYYFFESIKTKLPEDYVLFKKIYDPENKYLEALEIELNKYKDA